MHLKAIFLRRIFLRSETFSTKLLIFLSGVSLTSIILPHIGLCEILYKGVLMLGRHDRVSILWRNISWLMRPNKAFHSNTFHHLGLMFLSLAKSFYIFICTVLTFYKRCNRTIKDGIFTSNWRRRKNIWDLPKYHIVSLKLNLQAAISILRWQEFDAKLCRRGPNTSACNF